MKKVVCIQCGTEINGGCYNTPRGVFCCKCYEEVPQRTKDKFLQETLQRLAEAGKLLR